MKNVRPVIMMNQTAQLVLECIELLQTAFVKVELMS